MRQLSDVRSLFEEGRYKAALLALGGREPQAPELAALFAESLHEVGDSEGAERTLGRLIQSPATPVGDRASALRLLAGIRASSGNANDALVLLRESLTLAESQALSPEACQSALHLFSLLSNLKGPSETAVALLTAKKHALRSNEPRLLAELHSRVGQADAQTGRLTSATRHLSLALSFLKDVGHLGILARTQLALASTYALLSDNTRALDAGHSALRAATESGSTRLELLCRANLAQLLLRADELEQALDVASTVLGQVSGRTYLHLAVLETFIAAALELGKLDSVGQYIEEFLGTMAASKDESWIAVEAVPTYVRVLESRGEYEAAATALESGITRSELRTNHLNSFRLRLMRSERHLVQGQLNEAVLEVQQASSSMTVESSAEQIAALERSKGLIAYQIGARRLARQHLGRAERVFRRTGLLLEARRTRVAKHEVLSRVSPGRVLVRRAGQLEAAAGIDFLSRLGAYPRLLQSEVERLITHLNNIREGARASRDDGIRIDIEVGAQDSAESLSLTLRASPTLWGYQSLSTVQQIVQLATHAASEARRRQELEHFWDFEASESTFGIYTSSEMRGLLKTAQIVAKTDFPVLILGETGVGKEVLAAEIHASSPRANRPFIPFNVTAVSRDLLESQLFGARKGSFTGATQDIRGLLREADGGTVFLDEIGEMSLDLQPKLLRFVEQGEIQPVGDRPQHVDVRIIAATNASLQDLVRQGRFREDLYHRLRVVPLTIPPLRERREEIATLARHFVEQHAGAARRRVPEITPAALERLVAADWPGNVRQLSNELRRVIALLPEGAAIDVEHLSPDIREQQGGAADVGPVPTGRLTVSLDRPLDDLVRDVERAAIERALTLCGGNLSEVARRLGITRKGLYLKRERLGMTPDRGN